MKWLVFICVALCLRHAEGGALRCVPGSQDRSCSTDLEEKDSPIHLSRDDSPGESSSGLECRPGSEWERNCHSCRCTDSGRAQCQKKDVCETGLLDVEQENGESATHDEKLIPFFGKEIDVELNLVDNGIHGYHTIFKRSLCRPNQEFKADCNICKCSPTGGSYKCTQNECMEEDGLKEVEVFGVGPGVDHVEKQTLCRPRAIFHISCNACRCNYDGTNYSCTENPCPIPQDVELIRELKVIRSPTNESKSVVCIANRMFIKDCNTCWCNEDGTSYFCTRRVCVEESPDEIRDGDIPEALRTTKKQCKPHAVFKMDCNTCTCNEDGTLYSCTKAECLQEKNFTLSRKIRDAEQQPTAKKLCEPGHHIQKDCNSCTCNSDGTSYSCTRMECYNPNDPAFIRKSRSIEQDFTLSRKSRASQQEDAPKTCQPGQEFRMDCNKCLCDNKGQGFSCTRIDCDAVNNNHQAAAFTQPRTKREAEKAPAGCKPGEIFSRGCNVCRCSPDGLVATCTIKTCPTDKDGVTDQSVTDPDQQSFRCNAGEQFKQDCNDCTCSADGKSVFCTVRLCDMDLTPDI